MSTKSTLPVTGLLTIDLAAIAANWKYLNSYTGDDSYCAAVVKANAYGLGMEPIVKSLWSAGCRIFFVATLIEAKALRLCLSGEYEIIVLGGLSHDIGDECSPDWISYQLTPVLFSVAHVERWAQFCASKDHVLPSVVKVDTGMHRLGLHPQECERLLENSTLASAHPSYLMSHFACADQPQHPLNKQQIERFKHVADQCRVNIPSIKLSLCNSAGIFLGRHVHFDVVRPGIALYGVSPSKGSYSMTPVIQVKLPVMQVKTIAVGDSVGYGAEFTAKRQTRIAVVFGGYADGLFRSLGNTAFAFYRGHKVPLIGRVSMDSVVFDITDTDDELSSSMGYVELLGEGQSLDDLATAAGTIAYEILTSLGSRYERHYLEAKL